MFYPCIATIVAVLSLMLACNLPGILQVLHELPTTTVPYTTLGPEWRHHDSQPHVAHPGVSIDEKPSDWHIHHHLGGNGPWVSNVDTTTNELQPPPGCVVEQVHMLSRHAERYPTKRAGTRLLHLLQRLQHEDVTLVGDLAFANKWKFFTSTPHSDFDQLTRSGLYAGTLAAFTTGVKLRTRYGHLLDNHFQRQDMLNLWAGDSERVIETAQHFAAGLLGLDWTSQATLHIIPESPVTGGNTLTPGKACLAYLEDVKFGREGGYAALAQFTDTTFPQTAARLQKLIETKGTTSLQLSTVDVYAMQELCGFEILTRGSSAWCDVFTEEEWERFAYARDLLHFYRAGPGGKYSHSMGMLYLNATAKLMLQGPSAGPLFFSFVHDGDVVPVLSALHILLDDGPLPMTHVMHNRSWKSSRLTPMGGRIILERLRCDDLPEGTFVRININDGIISMPDCDTGSGLCPLDQFVARLRRHQEAAGDFREVCKLKDEMPGHIAFLHQ